MLVKGAPDHYKTHESMKRLHDSQDELKDYSQLGVLN